MGLWIKFDSFVAHMFYTWSLIHNTAVPIAIKKRTVLFTWIHTLLYFIGELVNIIKYYLTIIFIYITKLKSIQFKWNPKNHHCNHNWYFAFILKDISQINWFSSIFSSVIISCSYIVDVGMKVYWIIVKQDRTKSFES